MPSLPASEIRKLNDAVFHFPEVRVVEASAGSGKTYALAKRYIQILFNPSLALEQIPIRQILAITFTNKAAFEMKARILEFLKNIALERLSPRQQEEILAPLGLDQKQAGAKAYLLMEEIIRHYNFFQVQTIDKFINALLVGCAFKIGLTANFRIQTNAREYLEHSLDLLIDQARRDEALKKMFEDFLHGYLYLENRTGWFPKDDMLRILSALFTQHNFYGRKFQPSPYTPEGLIREKKKALELMRLLRQDLPEAADKRFVKSLDAFLEKHTQLFDMDSVSEYFARPEMPLRQGAEASRDLQRMWTQIRAGLRRVCEEEARVVFDPYIKIFEAVQEGIRRLCAKDDVLFLEELNSKACRLFDENEVTVAELYYRLAGRFRHYLMDEFQDTSRLQWNNLQKMVEEALATGGSLFYVGDRKQAIYGFRGGESSLFDEIKDRFSAFNVRVDFLTQNWRSQKAVVDFNNAVFSGDNLRRLIRCKQDHDEDKKKRNAVGFSAEDVRMLESLFQGAGQKVGGEGKDGGYVRVEYAGGNQKDDQDEIIRARTVAFIRDLEQRFSYAQIAVLTRSNTQVEQLTGWLLEEGIPVESERTCDVTQNNLIQELACFLRFLESPVDNIAFAGFILGDILPAVTAVPKETFHHFVFTLRDRLRDEKDFYIYRQFRETFPEVWQKFMEDFFKNAGLYPLYEFVVSIYHRFDLLRRFPQEQGFFMHFLELIKQNEPEYPDISAFLEYFEHLKGEDLYVHTTGTDAVKILTIHKAKGLEFPAVILPFLGMDVQVGAKTEDSAQSYILRREDAAMELLRLKEKYLGFSETLSSVYAQEYKKAFAAELNNIYVALTRAAEELYILIPKRIGNSFNLAQFLIPEGLMETGAKRAALPKTGVGVVSPSIPLSDYHDWIGYLKDEFKESASGAGRRQRFEGEVVHFILSRIGSVDGENQERKLQEALRQARRNFPQICDFSSYEKIVERILANKALEPFFYCGGAEVFMEKEIVGASGRLKRLDRLIVREKQVWVVDFKSTRGPGGLYEQQVREYQDLIREVYPDKEVKGFLVYLDSGEVEEV